LSIIDEVQHLIRDGQVGPKRIISRRKKIVFEDSS
jgi:hypothetical protein